MCYFLPNIYERQLIPFHVIVTSEKSIFMFSCPCHKKWICARGDKVLKIEKSFAGKVLKIEKSKSLES